MVKKKNTPEANSKLSIERRKREEMQGLLEKDLLRRIPPTLFTIKSTYWCENGSTTMQTVLLLQTQKKIFDRSTLSPNKSQFSFSFTLFKIANSK
jgi:hypothetical protein